MFKKAFLTNIDALLLSILFHLATDLEHKIVLGVWATVVMFFYGRTSLHQENFLSLGPFGLPLGAYTYFRNKQTQRRLLDKIDQLHEELIKLANTNRVAIENIQELNNLLIDLTKLQYQLSSNKSSFEAFKKFESLYLEDNVTPEEFIEKLQRNLCMRTLFLQSKRLKPLSPKSEGGIRLFETST